MNKAKELIEEYENQYRLGFRTASELVTVIAKTAGIYGGKEAVAHISPEFIQEIIERVSVVPDKNDFVVFKVSESESSVIYRGLIELHEELVKKHNS